MGFFVLLLCGTCIYYAIEANKSLPVYRYSAHTLDSQSKVVMDSIFIKQTLQFVPIRDYQLLIVEDSILVYDGKRHVGNILYTKDDEIGRLIYDDAH